MSRNIRNNLEPKLIVFRCVVELSKNRRNDANSDGAEGADFFGRHPRESMYPTLPRDIP